MPTNVALVGFPCPLPANGRGVLERCGLLPVEFSTPEAALHAIRTWLRVDAVVIDSHHDLLTRHRAAALELFELAAAAPEGAPIPVILLTSSVLSPDLRQQAEHLGVRLMASKHQSYRDIGRLVGRLCCLDDSCCPRPGSPAPSHD